MGVLWVEHTMNHLECPIKSQVSLHQELYGGFVK